MGTHRNPSNKSRSSFKQQSRGAGRSTSSSAAAGPQRRMWLRTSKTGSWPSRGPGRPAGVAPLGALRPLAELASRALKAERSREPDAFLVRRETNPRLRPARTTCGGLGPAEPKTKPHTDSNLWNKALTHKKPYGWYLEVFFFAAFMAHPKLFEVSPLLGV